MSDALEDEAMFKPGRISIVFAITSCTLLMGSPPPLLAQTDRDSHAGRGDVPGDADGDKDVDLSDLGILLSAWDSRPGDDNWYPDADFDGNGHIGQSDLGILLSDWG